MSALSSPHEDESDVDCEIRIEKMKRELEELSGGSFASGSFWEVSPELDEIFLERVLDFEKTEYHTNFNRLIESGVEMVPPAELNDAGLHAKLREVLCALAAIRCFLHDTDHLSDRELYTWLWTDGLREETPDLPRLWGAWHTSPIGSCTDQDIATFLKYYASKEERHRWKKDFVNDVLRPCCPLPYDRDRTLPRPE